MSWTEAKVKKLEELWGKGSTASQIERRGEVIYYKISKINFNQNILKTDKKNKKNY